MMCGLTLEENTRGAHCFGMGFSAYPNSGSGLKLEQLSENQLTGKVLHWQLAPFTSGKSSPLSTASTVWKQGTHRASSRGGAQTNPG